MISFVKLPRFRAGNGGTNVGNPLVRERKRGFQNGKAWVNDGSGNKPNGGLNGNIIS